LERLSEKSKAAVAHEYRVRNMITTAKLVAMKALERTSSLGPHFRSDDSPAPVDRIEDERCKRRKDENMKR
jgi:aspartate oxidase